MVLSATSLPHFCHLQVTSTGVVISLDLDLDETLLLEVDACLFSPDGKRILSPVVAGVLAPDGGVHDLDVSGDRGADKKAVPGIPHVVSPFLCVKKDTVADEQDDILSLSAEEGVDTSFGGKNGNFPVLLLLFVESSYSELK